MTAQKKSRKRYVYKVVKRTGKELESCIVRGPMSLKYGNFWTKAKEGGCLVFGTLYYAKDFASPDEEIWRALGRGRLHLPKFPLVTIPETLKSSNVRRCWTDTEPNVEDNWQWPTGTQAYKEIRLVSRVQ